MFYWFGINQKSKPVHNFKLPKLLNPNRFSRTSVFSSFSSFGVCPLSFIQSCHQKLKLTCNIFFADTKQPRVTTAPKITLKASGEYKSVKMLCAIVVVVVVTSTVTAPLPIPLMCHCKTVKHNYEPVSTKMQLVKHAKKVDSNLIQILRQASTIDYSAKYTDC